MVKSKLHVLRANFRFRLIAAGQLRLVYVGLVRNQSIEADKEARSLFTYALVG